MVNGGILYPPTFVKRAGEQRPGQRVIQAKTSQMMRQLLRLNVIQGTGKNAERQGYEVGGKTGTAEKPGHGGYRQKALISFVCWRVPDERAQVPRAGVARRAEGTNETGGYATGGWSRRRASRRSSRTSSPSTASCPATGARRRSRSRRCRSPRRSCLRRRSSPRSAAAAGRAQGIVGAALAGGGVRHVAAE